VKALRFTPGYGSRLLLRSAGTTIACSERTTNLRLHEMTAGVISLFPACYLQWVLQLTRAGRIETLKILPARCRCHHELAVERLLPCQANRGGRIRRCSLCDSSIGTHGFSCDGGCAAAGKPSRSL